MNLLPDQLLMDQIWSAPDPYFWQDDQICSTKQTGERCAKSELIFAQKYC
jgi:hypothetical protein